MNYCIERKIGSTKIECLICEIELWGSAYLHDNAEKAWNIFLTILIPYTSTFNEFQPLKIH